MYAFLWHIGAGVGFREFLAEFEVVLIPLIDIALKDLLAYKIGDKTPTFN